MNIRMPLTALTLFLASGLAMAATPTPATPAAPATPATAAAPVKHADADSPKAKANANAHAHKLAKECKAKGGKLVKGKCETAKTTG